MHRCIICLGSNYQCKEHLGRARRMLSEAFPQIRFAAERLTSPYGLSNPSPFSNQVALIDTPFEEQKVYGICKTIEAACGRLPEDKKQEIVRIDIDLLRIDDKIRKEEDFNRFYVQHSLKELIPLVDDNLSNK